ncbi:MAG: MFS transporter [Candidatus Syntrophopropionicum ammoniitolerans]
MLLRNQTLLVSGGVILVASIGFGFIDPLLPGYFHGKFAATPLIIGIMFVAISATSIIAQPLFGALSDKLGRVPIIISGMLFTAGVLPLLTFAPTIKTTMLVMGGIGITFGLMTAPALRYWPMPSVSKRPTSYGAAFGLYNTAFSLGYIIYPLAGGAFVDVLGLKNLFGIYGIVLLCYLPVFLLCTRKFRHPAVGRSP